MGKICFTIWQKFTLILSPYWRFLSHLAIRETLAGMIEHWPWIIQYLSFDSCTMYNSTPNVQFMWVSWNAGLFSASVLRYIHSTRTHAEIGMFLALLWTIMDRQTDCHSFSFQLEDCTWCLTGTRKHS